MPDTKLDVLRAASFDWTLRLQSIWSDLPYHVPGIHAAQEQSFAAELQQLKAAEPASRSPLGWVLAGVGGVGKTHLLNGFRAEAVRQRCAFILVDMTDVNDFWETVLVGYTSSLQEPYVDGEFQHRFLLENLIGQLSAGDAARDNLKRLLDADVPTLKKHGDRVLGALAIRARKETFLYQDVIRALLATCSDDFGISNLGQTWLQGLSIEPEDAKGLGLRKAQERPIEIVRALSWLISLSAPAVVAFDQLDPIVRQLEFDAVRGSDGGDTRLEADANSIISGIGDGLRGMLDVTRRSLTILSCLEKSWAILSTRALQTSADRFEKPVMLEPIAKSEILKAMVTSRMKPACESLSFTPSCQTWPFSESAFEGISGVTPRELLKRCEEHRKTCLANGTVAELSSFVTEPASSEATSVDTDLAELDAAYDTLRKNADVAWLLDERKEDERLGPLVQATCACMLKECSFPRSVHAVLDTEFTGGRTTKPLHGRVRLIFHDEQEREEHFSVRVVQRLAPRAYQNRLKLALTQSGIDAGLGFRRLVVVRTNDQPGGKVTAQLTEKFRSAGGEFHAPPEDDVRTMCALCALLQKNDPNLESWLRARRPASQLGFCQTAFASVLERFHSNGTAQPAAPEPLPKPEAKPETKPKSVAAPAPAAPPASDPPATGGPTPPVASKLLHGCDLGSFPLGKTVAGGKARGPVAIPIDLLEKHVVVLAGAGSGKTVLLKRMIEEAALRGIPSIVVDGANDMAALGDRWPERPAAWSKEDFALAERYHSQVEKCVWTPGRQSANPLRLEVIPDLGATASDPDEFRVAIEMVTGALVDMLGLGKSKADMNKGGIISKALRYFVEQGGAGLQGFIELLADLPPEAMLGIGRETNLAKDLSDGLRVLCERDPMLSDSGEVLDPAVLFGDSKASDRTRISIINLAFLANLETQQRFVNQLATTLFAWIKKNPNPPGRPLRGLLVLDEAKDFVPGRRSTPCKESLIRLTAQARKYHLGVVFATQNPREIENTIIGNCSTQYYGKASSKAAIDTIREQLSMRGGQGADVGRLERGVFYTFNADADMTAPTKVQVPLCLSHHVTLDSDEVLKRAEGNAC